MLSADRSLNREILKLSIPSILANITVPLVGMVDIAIAGHLGTQDIGAAALIGGITIGSMLFDLLYWNFGFLRVSTGGLTAQAYGRSEFSECGSILMRSSGIALLSALVLIALQWVVVKGAFLIVDCSPEVQALATRYFLIRIWAAPATLSLMAFKGWFIGMQDSIAAMATDLMVNIVNIAASFALALGFNGFGTDGVCSWGGLGFNGVALGTVAAQYSGLAVALGIFLIRYRRKVHPDGRLKDVYTGEKTRRFFTMNGDIFVRSLCFIAIYIGYTIISARYGDVLLACSSILMKLLMIFSYFIDGFAYAGEAMCGKYIGARQEDMLRKTIHWCFVWSAALALFFVFIYGLGGTGLLRMMTSDATVVAAARNFIPWLMLMPVAGCGAFMWDGVFIGATQSAHIRNSMLWATLAFFAVWFAGVCFIHDDVNSMHLLMGAYFAHLFARTIYLSIKAGCIQIGR